MLADTLFRVPRAEGVQLLQRRGEHGARELTSHRLRLAAGGTARFGSPGEETVVVLQEGNGTFAAAGKSWRVSRSGVFNERATALLLPPGVEVTVTAETPLEAVLVSTPACAGLRRAVIGPG